MSIEDHVHGIGPKPAGGFGRPGPAAPRLPEVQGADFARILEELMAAAGNLGSQAAESRQADPQAIQQAVEEAKQSLDSALSLGESLLEAYRRALIADPGSGSKKR